MADYYTEFSEHIDDITSEEWGWIESQLDVERWDPDVPPEWDAPLDYEVLDFEWEFITEVGATALWIHAGDAGDPGQVGDFVKAFLARFRPEECFGLTFANTCTRPLLGQFSRGGLFVTSDGYDVFSAYAWVEDRIVQFKGRPPSGDEEGPVTGDAPRIAPDEPDERDDGGSCK